MKEFLKKLLVDGKVKNIAVKVGIGDIVIDECYLSSDESINEYTLFDMASVTKILATTSLMLIALDRGLISLDDKASSFFNCEDRGITIQHLLTHTIGVGHRNLCLPDYNYDNIAERILSMPFEIPVGTDVIYSCPAFIVLGKIAEKVLGDRLDRLFNNLVAKPLEMNRTSFLPLRRDNTVNSNPEESGRGKVNDYNCSFLGGVAGNAGVFSCMADMTRFAHMLLNKGGNIYSDKIFNLAKKNYTANMSASRGLGFLYVDKRYKQTGDLFPEGAIGHCGHTGQSVFVDTDSGLYVIVLSDATRYTSDYGTVMKMREEIHNELRKTIK